MYLNGSLVTSATFVPLPVAQSSAEVEYNACAFALTESICIRQVWNFLHDKHLDSPLTFAMFTDAESAIAMIDSDHVTKNSRHIDRRIHFVKQAQMRGMFQINPSNAGTKNLLGNEIKKHLPMIHVCVPA